MARVFHGCMNKNNDGTNRVIEKTLFVFGLPVGPFGRESEMWISE